MSKNRTQSAKWVKNNKIQPSEKQRHIKIWLKKKQKKENLKKKPKQNKSVNLLISGDLAQQVMLQTATQKARFEFPAKTGIFSADSQMGGGTKGTST